MKRRILSLIMVALLLLPAAFSMAASTPVTVTAADIQGNVGDTVTATLNITIEAPKLGQTMDSLQFVLEYDSAALEYVGIQEVSQDKIKILGVSYMCNVTAKAGAVAFAASANGGATGSGVLMHVQFRILSAVSTMLVLKKVSYSFVTTSSVSQRGYTGGTMNLGRIIGQSAPTTVAPASYAPDPQPSASAGASYLATDSPRFPVTEVTLAPGASPTAQPVEGDNDVLAYIVFGLFIVVAIMICVVVTLMIVRRGRKKAQEEFFEDDEDDAEDDRYTDRYEKRYDNRYDDRYEEEQDDRAYRRGYSEAKEQPKPKKKKKYSEYDEEDEPSIEIVRTSKKSGSSTTTKKKPKNRDY